MAPQSADRGAAPRCRAKARVAHGAKRPNARGGRDGRPGIFIADAHAQLAASGAIDKQLEFIEGADHFMRAGGSRAFKAAGNMTVARTFQSATALRDGRVLIAGGTDAGDQALATAELYDPATGKFALTADPMQQRATARSLSCSLTATSTRARSDAAPASRRRQGALLSKIGRRLKATPLNIGPKSLALVDRHGVAPGMHRRRTTVR